jgi:hypothetical protein
MRLSTCRRPRRLARSAPFAAARSGLLRFALMNARSDGVAMMTEAVKATGRILLFRAGPEDFPFDTGTLLLRLCIVFGLIANAAFALVMMPALPALVSSAVVVGALALSTRWVLRMRKLDNRFQQTFNALLLTTSFHTLLLTPLFAQMAPQMRAWFEAVEQHPDVPQAWPQDIPTGVSLLFDAIFIWMVSVTLSIYRRAFNVGWAGSIGAGLLCLLAMMLLTLFTTPLVAVLTH